MRRYTVLAAVPEVITGLSYFLVEVEAEDDDQAQAKAKEVVEEQGDLEFIGFEGYDSDIDWQEVQVQELLSWDFQPGQRVLLRQSPPELFPELEVEVVRLRDHFGRNCPVCYLGRDRSSFRPEDGKQYFVKYPSGVVAPVDSSRLYTLKEELQPMRQRQAGGM